MDLEKLLNKLRRYDLRITPQRRSILALLLDRGDHLTAKEVHAGIADQFPDISLDTVYRNLRLLAMLGIICQSHLKTGGVSRFALTPGDFHHHHLICIDCGTAEKFDDCPVPDFMDEVTARHGFKPAGHALEIYGYCQPCQTGGVTR